MKHHCQMFAEIFEEYFKEDYTDYIWIRNPFTDTFPETLTTRRNL